MTRTDDRRWILVVSGGPEAVPGIERARELGFAVVASDKNAEAPGLALADRAILASTYDAEATAEAAAAFHRDVAPLSGVLSVGADVPVTVSTVAERLGLPGLPVKSANVAANKLAMKRAFLARDIAVPWFDEVHDARDVAAARRARGRTLVVKPIDSRGSRGVTRLDAQADAAFAFETAQGYSPSGRVMVEDYLEGPQISTESAIVDGRIATPGFSDRNYEHLARFAPYFVEDGGDLPSRICERTRAEIEAVLAETAAALGLVNGTLKGDIVISDGRPHVIEVAPRLSGGYFASHEIPLSTGVDLLGAAIRLAVGDLVDIETLRPVRARPVVQRYKFVEAGEIVSIEGAEVVRRMPGIETLILHAKVGDIVRPTTNTTSRAAMVLATGGCAGEARMRARAALDALRIRTRAVAQPALAKAG
ncbi:MAG: ATP-grasp domain-containing protein [Alphaproteobacteria bacterium]|nr:ATP-grasp domain-containing protein [Alphaproteobacteria bacterium]